LKLKVSNRAKNGPKRDTPADAQLSGQKAAHLSALAAFDLVVSTIKK
jgi:hypothetical protein